MPTTKVRSEAKLPQLENCTAVNYKELSSWLYLGPSGTYYGKLLKLLLKPAKVDGRKLSFLASLRKLVVHLSTIHIDSI